MEHYENPRNVGSLDKNSSTVGTVRRTVVVLSDTVCLFHGVDDSCL